MPDFLSRLVERTFGLAAVSQPVTHSIFAPEASVKSDYVQGLAHRSEFVSNQYGIHIENPQTARVIQQNDDQPALNREKEFNNDDAKPPGQIEDRNSQSNFTLISRTLHKTEQLRQNDSDSLEQIESVPLQQTNEQDNQYMHKTPAELAQSKGNFYKIESDALEPVEPELLYVKNQNERSILRLIPKSMLHEKQSRDSEQDSQRHLEPFVTRVDSLSGKTLMDHKSDSSLTSGRSSSLRSIESLVPNSEPSSRADFYSPGYQHSDDQLLPRIPSRQNFKLVSNPNVNTNLEQMNNMLIEQHAVAPRSPSTAPTIKVTIGRIEVRAVKPTLESQPQIPPQKQHQILSLDDYLKQYNE
ncbi:MAG TPA: hypothetical protein VHO68_04635 [Bacteroidales bacterium]|nr:hypothetical protein [Bacteroidales bacterium]